MGPLKPLFWLGTSRAKLREFPEAVRRAMGFALYLAQAGDKHPDAQPLKGFGGAGVVEVADDYDGETYRAVYTVKLAGAVYTLHAFQKKSKKGVATPKRDLDLIRTRFRQAREHHAGWTASAREGR